VTPRIAGTPHAVQTVSDRWRGIIDRMAVDYTVTGAARKNIHG